ncbi:MAG: histidinol-phosphate transaminase [Alphaproteobacteria bacterium]
MTDKPQPYIRPAPARVSKAAPPPGGGRLIDLSLNESSYGPSPLAVEAARERAAWLERYPDPASTELREAIAGAHGLEAERLICGNGSEELLDVVGRVYARPGDEVLFGHHAFFQFEVVAMRVGATAVKAPERDLTIDVDALLAGVTDRTRILYVANPNNPTGTYVTASELRRLHAALPPRVVLVIDAAYAEYMDDEAGDVGFGIARDAGNVLVLRTFSKAFGLAGLRVGWGYGPPETIGAMNRVRGVGNVNAIAQSAAVAALRDTDHVAEVVARTGAERARVREALTALGIDVAPSAANFVLARFPGGDAHAAAAHAHLLRHGIVVGVPREDALTDCLRIGIGLADENDAVIGALEHFSP